MLIAPERVNLWSGLGTTTLLDYTGIPDAPLLLASNVEATVQRNAMRLDTRSALGMEAMIGAIMYFDVSLSPILQNVKFVQDSYGDTWAVSSEVSVRADFGNVTYCKIICQQLKDMPIGLPLFGSLQVYQGGRASVTDQQIWLNSISSNGGSSCSCSDILE